MVPGRRMVYSVRVIKSHCKFLAGLTWRCFRNLPSAAEASMVAENCLFSLATLEVTAIPRTDSFALTECEHTGVWRWAIISAEGTVVGGGREPTALQAKELAETALRLIAV